ncbi:MAG: chlorite dismutase [Candidatus Melainabacteria bacterium]|nr:MAG: chlorite dismutase [Candidatus Melainabacteria bacterium]
MSNVTTERQVPGSKAPAKLKRQFVSFACFKVDPAWRRLPKEERQKGKEEFEAVVDKYVADKTCQILSYTLMGTRADVDLMLWVIAYELEPIQQLATDLAKTGLGTYMNRPYSFLAMTKRSMYLDRFDPEHQEDRVHIIPGKHKYFFVYPFVKKRDWYVLSQTERQEMMDEHIKIGNKYPSVKLNTTYSFGLDDQEFVVAFETDSPSDFLDLVQELRESKASMYTLRDTPILTCLFRPIKEALDSLG